MARVPYLRRICYLSISRLTTHSASQKELAEYLQWLGIPIASAVASPRKKEGQWGHKMHEKFSESSTISPHTGWILREHGLDSSVDPVTSDIPVPVDPVTSSPSRPADGMKSDYCVPINPLTDDNCSPFNSMTGDYSPVSCTWHDTLRLTEHPLLFDLKNEVPTSTAQPTSTETQIAKLELPEQTPPAEDIEAAHSCEQTIKHPIDQGVVHSYASADRDTNVHSSYFPSFETGSAQEECPVPRNHNTHVHLSGISGRFPGARDAWELKELLRRKDARVDKEQWCPTSLPGKTLSVLRIHGHNWFDADFWQMTDDEASRCNPVLRLLLEVVYECVMDSGLTLKDLQSSSEKTGIYLSVPNDLDGYMMSKKERSPYEATSFEMATVIGGKLRLKGPAICYHANSNPSAVAIHSAIMDLQRGVVHYAIVAGGNLILNPYTALAMHEEMKAANWNIPQAETIAAILLIKKKTLCRRIYCKVTGAGVSCFASTASLIEEIQMFCQQQKSKIRDFRFFGEKNSSCEVSLMQNEELPDLLGHCDSATALVAIISSVLIMQLDFKRYLQATCRQDEQVAVITRGLRSEQGYVILEVYFTEDYIHHDVVPKSKLALLPMQLRETEDFKKKLNQIGKSVSRNHMLQLLSRSMLIKDVRPSIPAYAIVYNDSRWDALQDKDACVFKSVEIPTSENIKNCTIFFGDFFQFMEDDSMNDCDIPGFRASIMKCSKVMEELKESHSNVFQSKYSYIYFGVEYQLALADALKQCVGNPLPSSGVGLGVLAAAYYDGCLTLRQCLLIVCCLISTLENWSQGENIDYETMVVELRKNQVYTLGPRVTVLSVYTDCLSLIAIPKPASNTCLHHEKSKDSVSVMYGAQSEGCSLAATEEMSSVVANLTDSENPEEEGKSGPAWDADFPHAGWPLKEVEATAVPASIRNIIRDKGGVYSDIPLTPFYSQDFSPAVRNLLLNQIRTVISKPVMWSKSAMHVSHFGRKASSADLLCSAESIIDHLFFPIDQPAMLRYALMEPSVVVVTILPVLWDTFTTPERIDFEEIAGANPRLLHLWADVVEFYSVLGELHLFGYELNIEDIECDEPSRPLSHQGVVGDCRDQPLSPLMTWNHHREWPVPSWSAFTNTGICYVGGIVTNIALNKMRVDDNTHPATVANSRADITASKSKGTEKTSKETKHKPMQQTVRKVLINEQTLQGPEYQQRKSLVQVQKDTAELAHGAVSAKNFEDLIYQLYLKGIDFDKTSKEGLSHCQIYFKSHFCLLEQWKYRVDLLMRKTFSYIRVMFNIKAHMTEFTFEREQTLPGASGVENVPLSEGVFFSTCYRLWRFNAELCHTTSTFLLLLYQTMKTFLKADIVLHRSTSRASISRRSMPTVFSDRKQPQDFPARKSKCVCFVTKNSKAEQLANTNVPPHIAQQKMTELKERLQSLYADILEHCRSTRHFLEDLADQVFAQLLDNIKQGEEQRLMLMSVLMTQILHYQLIHNKCRFQPECFFHEDWWHLPKLVTSRYLEKYRLVFQFCKLTDWMLILGVYADLLADNKCLFGADADKVRKKYLAKLICIRQWAPSSQNNSHLTLVKRIQLLTRVEKKLLSDFGRVNWAESAETKSKGRYPSESLPALSQSKEPSIEHSAKEQCGGEDSYAKQDVKEEHHDFLPFACGCFYTTLSNKGNEILKSVVLLFLFFICFFWFFCSLFILVWRGN